MPQMISTTLKRYDGKDLKPGEPFEVAEKDVRVLKLSRKAKLVDDPNPLPEVGTYATRVMRPGSPRGARVKKNEEAKP